MVRFGLEDPDAQAVLAEQGFEGRAQGFEDFAAMTPGSAVDLFPVRRDMELFFAVVQSRGCEFYVKLSLRLQSTTGSFGVGLVAHEASLQKWWLGRLSAIRTRASL